MLSDPIFVPIIGREVQCIEVMIQTTNLLRFCAIVDGTVRVKHEP